MKKVLKNKILLLHWELTQAKLSKNRSKVKEINEDIQFYINKYKNIINSYE